MRYNLANISIWKLMDKNNNTTKNIKVCIVNNFLKLVKFYEE